MHIGVICSSGGSVFLAARRILESVGMDVTFSVVTDRQCSAEAECDRLGIAHRRIEFASRDDFDAHAWQWLREERNADWLALFYLRLIGPGLHSRLPCFNFHPSLLPAFAGFFALRRTLESGAKFFGATVHLVDDTVDGGPIVAQVTAPAGPGLREEAAARVSFAQKVYLLLLLVEIMQARALDLVAPFGRLRWRERSGPGAWNPIAGVAANPRIRDDALARAFVDFVTVENISWKP